jgi:hypothetical protein
LKVGGSADMFFWRERERKPQTRTTTSVREERRKDRGKERCRRQKFNQTRQENVFLQPGLLFSSHFFMLLQKCKTALYIFSNTRKY